MQSDRTPEKNHTALFHHMADAMGVNLEKELLSGRLKLEDLSQSIERCKGCAGPGACKVWLEHATPGQEDLPPGYCRNATFLRIQRVLGKLPQD
ncbi:MAG: DUF6455 family protein [Pseudomonadota bacterium]|nr:DUF6455 family protein [Pseudomonadota bacterium]MEC8293744.1 DUF6455 family protein [Pseudomonadota bacterium]